MTSTAVEPAGSAPANHGFLAEYRATTTTDSGAPCLALPPDLTFDQYREVVRLLGRISGSVPFYVGDAVLHGEAIYGEVYAQAMNDFGLAYQTLANYTHVCRWVEPDVRRADLSFGHHAAVSNMTKEVGGQKVPDKKQQRHWLEQAAAKDWSRQQMREAIAAASQPGKGQAPRKDPEADEAVDAAARDAALAQQGDDSPGAAAPAPLQASSNGQLSDEAWLHVLRDVYEAAVPISQLGAMAAQYPDSYWAVPIDVMQELASTLGEDFVVPEPVQPPVIEGAAVQVPPVAQPEYQAPEGGEQPQPEGDDGLGETFEL